MPEEVSPESKLYVKEEIEKSRKEIKEEVEKVKSKATKTFTTVALVVGLLTGLGVYGFAKEYIKTTIEDNLGAETLAEIEKNRIQAKNSYNKIIEYETDANDILSSLSFKTIIGTIVPYGGEIADSEEPIEIREGWFFCNGASLDREKYEDLYNVIGVAFGEPNSDTFNLPDLRGRFVRGVDHGTGRDPDADKRDPSNKGGNPGSKVGSYQQDALKKHTHRYLDWEHAVGPGGEHPGAGGKTLKPETAIAGDSGESRPKNVYVNWIIKAQ